MREESRHEHLELCGTTGPASVLPSNYEASEAGTSPSSGASSGESQCTAPSRCNHGVARKEPVASPSAARIPDPIMARSFHLGELGPRLPHYALRGDGMRGRRDSADRCEVSNVRKERRGSDRQARTWRELPVPPRSCESKTTLAPAPVAVSEYLTANAPGRWNGPGSGGVGKWATRCDFPPASRSDWPEAGPRKIVRKIAVSNIR